VKSAYYRIVVLCQHIRLVYNKFRVVAKIRQRNGCLQWQSHFFVENVFCSGCRNASKWKTYASKMPRDRVGKMILCDKHGNFPLVSVLLLFSKRQLPEDGSMNHKLCQTALVNGCHGGHARKFCLPLELVAWSNRLMGGGVKLPFSALWGIFFASFLLLIILWLPSPWNYTRGALVHWVRLRKTSSNLKVIPFNCTAHPFCAMLFTW